MKLINFLSKRCHHGQSPVNNWIVRRVSRKLQLNEAQSAKLSSLHNTIISSKSYIAETRKDQSSILDDVFSNNGFDRELAIHYLNVPRLAFEEQAPIVIDALGDFYQSLNSRQQDQFRSMFLKHYQQQKRCRH